MNVINTTEALAEFCKRASEHEFITVDTEFLRESTYFAKLCLVQVAYPAEEGVSDEVSAAVIDVLAKEISLDPLLALFRDPKIVKVFHAARQDLEIFYHDFALLPTPFFDTQIAAMVAGFGEQVGYETLVRTICKGKVDKTNRFTDWSRRPLSEAQISYARSDVTYLRDIYVYFVKELTEKNRLAWVQEELDAMTREDQYLVDPEQQWKRVRARTHSPKFMAIVRELAAFRERYAIEKNIPRSRVFKDDLLLEIAAQKPKSVGDLMRLRLWPKGEKKGPLVDGALSSVARALALDPADYPEIAPAKDRDPRDSSVIDLLKVYLKAQSDRHDVAGKLICTSPELEAFVADPQGDHALLNGWRREIFGEAALKILEGKVALRPNGRYVEAIEVTP